MTEKIEHSKMNVKEIEKIIIDLAKQGNSSEKIGLILRDQHGVAKVKKLGIRIGSIMEKNGFNKNNDKKNILAKIENLGEHFKQNKHDYTAQRKAVMYASRIKKMEKLGQ
jgi:small subunit ribosomal protein S15